MHLNIPLVKLLSPFNIYIVSKDYVTQSSACEDYLLGT